MLGVPRAVESLFSPGSRYSYLAASQVPRIEAEFGCRFGWRPVGGLDIRALRGSDPFQGPAISGRYEWSYRTGTPRRRPNTTESPFESRQRITSNAATQLKAAESYRWALSSAVYGSAIWPLDRAACISLAHRGGSTKASSKLCSTPPEIRERLQVAAQEAHERGAFGVPTLFLEERMFWGNDRLVLLEHALSSR